ncbi:uncharacterized protein Dwil_GK28058 [Drosophila willistoni]|uniref:Uncharacterized protein n=1 Tax=Drosophila willistoni TaxID=7260 RepID=A0A0Q9WTM7_DROWI|nr:uncharacterized protein LOC26530060 [Drosophila willistoni]KRF99268.1 uncharacterized protein Dwil_GK28058 [Drosophila willistoni]
MEMDYSTYAQLVGCANVEMPAPESFYPEINGGRPWSVMQNPEMPNQNVSGNFGQTHQIYENMSEGSHNTNVNRQNPSSYQGSGASAYRGMARERKRIREMQARNGLYSPMDDSARYRSGDGQSSSSNYSSYAANGMNGNSYW